MYFQVHLAALQQSEERPTDSANAIVEDVLTEYRTEHDHTLPKIVYEARAIHRRRVGHRPPEPVSIDFEVCITILHEMCYNRPFYYIILSYHKYIDILYNIMYISPILYIFFLHFSNLIYIFSPFLQYCIYFFSISPILYIFFLHFSLPTASQKVFC